MNAPMPTTLIPLDRLGRSQYNVRKTGVDNGIAELAASIERDDLLQNLTVVEASAGSACSHEVVAGSRRLAALKLLAKQKKIPQNHPVPCRVIAADSAEAISLAENQLREQMHPADQFEAFKERVDAGEPIPDVAARFGVTEAFVKQRLRLCEVAPALIQAYRNGEMSLETLQAFTVTGDHERQLSAWERFGGAGNDGPYRARIIKSSLRREAISSTDPVAKFVGLKAYEKAGGAVITDMFADTDDEDGAPVTLSDVGLLEQLAIEKLEKRAAKEKRDAGLPWCLARVSFDYSARQEFGKVPMIRRDMTAAEAAEYASIEEQIEAKTRELDKLHEDDDFDDEVEHSLCMDIEELEEKRNAIDESLEQPDPDAAQYAGAVVTIGSNGKIEIHRNLIRPEDKKLVKPKPVTVAAHSRAVPGTASADGGGPKAAHSMALIRQLSAIRTAILRDRVARNSNPNTALVIMVYHMLSEDLRDEGTEGGCLMVTSRFDDLERDAPNIGAADSMRPMQVRRDMLLDPIRAALAETTFDQHDWTLLQYVANAEADTLLALLGICVAQRLHLVTGSEHGGGKSEVVARWLLSDELVAGYWKPTVGSYLGQVSKHAVISAVTEACGEEAARPLSSMKKGDAAEAAEKLLAGTGWLPSPLRTGKGAA